MNYRTISKCIIFFKVDVPTLEEKLDAKKKLLHIRPPKVDVVPRNRMKGKSGSSQKFKRKAIVSETKKKEYIKEALDMREQIGLNVKKKHQNKSYGPLLDRFVSKS